MPRLENWFMIGFQNTTHSHKAIMPKLLGVLASPHGDLTVGINIITSTVHKLDLEKSIAVTKSGTTYVLGNMRESWKDWLAESSAELKSFEVKQC